jgi:uncharacterized membrane protein
MYFLSLKALHILSVALFLGNIITGVFWKFHGDRIGTLASRAQALEGVIGSDRWFTVPGVVLIVATGVGMALLLHYPILGTPWILWSLVLFGISGAAFAIFVGPLQKKLLANVRAGMTGTWNQPEYQSLSSRWKLWGAIATLAPVIALVLMVTKPA